MVKFSNVWHIQKPLNTLIIRISATHHPATAMTDSVTAETYRQALQDSYELSQSVLDKLSEIKKDREQKPEPKGKGRGKAAAKTEEKDDNELSDDLNELQRKLIFDTLNLNKSKNAFKNDFFKINEENIKKVKNGDSSASNSFLLKLDIQTFKNNQQWDALNKSISKLPELQINSLLDFNNDKKPVPSSADGDVEMKDTTSVDDFIKSLDIPLEDIKKLLWSNTKLADVNKDEYLIPTESNTKLQKVLEESDIKKFRLVQLHDGYYQKKINMMKEMDRKWSSEINKIKNFVSSDINKMKNELGHKLDDANKEKDEKAKELDALVDTEGIADYDGEDIEEGEDVDDEDHEEHEPEEEQVEGEEEEEERTPSTATAPTAIEEEPQDTPATAEEMDVDEPEVAEEADELPEEEGDAEIEE